MNKSSFGDITRAVVLLQVFSQSFEEKNENLGCIQIGGLFCFFFLCWLLIFLFSIEVLTFSYLLQHCPNLLPLELPSSPVTDIPCALGPLSSLGSFRAIAKKISLTLLAFLAEVSRNSKPFSSA
jgi:hypothetical protein